MPDAPRRRTAGASRKGWCPGVLRPMATGDGLLVRVRVTGGILDLATAAALADAARRCGNGLIDLTSRANLQIRGVDAGRLSLLQDILRDLGLVDVDAAGEAARNVLASPLAGVDPSALLDIRPTTRAVERRFATDPAMHGLSPKFLVLIDDGSSLSLGDIRADIRCEAIAGPDGPCFTITSRHGAHGACAPGDVAEVVAQLALAAPTGRHEDPDSAEDASPPRSAPPHRVGQPFTDVVGAGVPFGRLTAETLTALVEAAHRSGVADLRLSPWRVIFLVRPSDPRTCLASLARVGFLVDQADTRLVLSACPGRPSCREATTATHADALTLADFGLRIHVSGCAKGCGQSGPAWATLVGRAGRYGIVWDGTARDLPAASGLSLAQTRSLIAARLAAHPVPA